MVAGRKVDVSVDLREGNAVEFGGPLTWVNALRDFIPFDGFTDPPYLDVSPSGIKAGFDLALPPIPLGVVNLANVSLGAQVNVPFIGESLDFRFSFCTRERPFHLTVWVFGGGGFFAITVTPKECTILEAAFEFGAAAAIDFGVASGSIEVMAGHLLPAGDGQLRAHRLLPAPRRGRRPRAHLGQHRALPRADLRDRHEDRARPGRAHHRDRDRCSSRSR